MERIHTPLAKSDIKPIRLGILASRNGTDARYIHAAIETKTLSHTLINAVITNNPGVSIIKFAKENDIPIEIINKKRHPNPSKSIYYFFRDHEVNLVICSGYMKLIGPELFTRIPVLNVHPADTQKYGGKNMYGDAVHEAVLKSGETATLPTIHAVNAEYDKGPIILQHAVPVLLDDTIETLRSRVQIEEGSMFVKVLSDPDRYLSSLNNVVL